MKAAATYHRKLLIRVLVSVLVVALFVTAWAGRLRRDAASARVAAEFFAWSAASGYDTVLDRDDRGGALVRRTLRTGSVATVYREAGRALISPSADPSGSRCAVATGTHDEILLLDLRRGRMRHRARLPGDLRVVAGPTWSPDGHRVAVGCDLGQVSDYAGHTVLVIDADTGHLTNRIRVPQIDGKHVGDVQVLWDKAGLLVSYSAADSDDGQTLSLSPETCQVQVAYPFRTIAISATGDLLLVRGGKCYLSSGYGRGRPRRLPVDPEAYAVSFSPDGKFLLFLAPVRTPIVFDNDVTRLWVVDVRTGDLALMEQGMTPQEEWGLALAKASWFQGQ